MRRSQPADEGLGGRNRSTHERVLDRKYAGLVDRLLVVSRDGGEGVCHHVEL